MATAAQEGKPATRTSPLPPLRWRWVVIGVLLGGILIATLVPVVEATPPRPDVAILVGILTFALMGVLVAFHSPGRTIAEAAVAGALLGVLTPTVLRLGYGISLPPATVMLGFLSGISLSAVGGWVGEVLQGTIEDGDRKVFQPVWVLVGTLLGVMLSVYAVFVPNALFVLTPFQTLLWFLSSFLVTAFVVAFFSPGATILEPATAAALVVLLDLELALAGFEAPFPLLAVMIAVGLGFLCGLIGGYLGEVAHNLYYRTAWGGTFRGVEVPKPEDGS